MATQRPATMNHAGRVTVLCSSPDHPVNPAIEQWAARQAVPVRIVRRAVEAKGGDFLFLVSCTEAIPAQVLSRYRHSLVLHASDLPKCRGWSPHVWAILEGDSEITVSLLNADTPIDSGDVWKKAAVQLTGTETCDDINAKLFAAELSLMSWALEHCDHATPEPQTGEPSYRPRRYPADSEVRPEQTLAEIFDLLRVSDPKRFPAHFYYRGEKFIINFQKAVVSSEASDHSGPSHIRRFAWR